MDREGGNKSHAKQISGRNMQQRAAMNLITPTAVPVMVPDPVGARNPNPTRTTTGSNPNPNPGGEPHARHEGAVNPRAAAAREQDQYLPIANVIRIMRRILPPHAKISDEAKETVQECVSEYISFITGEANDRCRREQRKTVTAEDVLWAMTKLGFDSYIAPLSLYLSRYRHLETSSAAPLDVPVTGKRRAAEYPPLAPAPAPAPPTYYPPPSPAAFPMMFYSPMTATATTMGAGDYLIMPPDGSGSGRSSSGQEFGGPVMGSNNFDPFGPFK